MNEARVCADLGIIFLSHPVPDMHLPDPTPFRTLAADIANHLRSGANIAVHCYASIGRSGMLACATLGHFGYSSAEAIVHVSQMRGTPVPDTPEQAAFIHNIMTHDRP